MRINSLVGAEQLTYKFYLAKDNHIRISPISLRARNEEVNSVYVIQDGGPRVKI